MFSSYTQHVRHKLLTDGALFAINKPTGYTSHDVIDRVRKILTEFIHHPGVVVVGKSKRNRKKYKVGHLGTLDPNASGVLPIAVGPATSYIRYFVNDERALKMYETTIKFGRSTTTDDAQGDVLREVNLSWLEREHVEKNMKYFQGEKIMQRPPMVSAKHINGERAHKLAREGKLDPSLILPVPVRIDELVLKNFRSGKLPEADIQVTCGGGMFVRSLGRDLGHQMLVENVGRNVLSEDAAWDCPDATSHIPGCGSLVTLNRTLSCGFHQEDAIEMNELETIIGEAQREEKEEDVLQRGERGEEKSKIEHQLMNLMEQKFRTVKKSLGHLKSTTIDCQDAAQRRVILTLWRQIHWLPVDGRVKMGGPDIKPVMSDNFIVVTMDDVFAGVGALSMCQRYMKRISITKEILIKSEQEEKRDKVKYIQSRRDHVPFKLEDWIPRKAHRPVV